MLLLHAGKINASDPWNTAVCHACNPPHTPACLFDVEADAEERVNLAAQMPDLVATMTARLKVLQATTYYPKFGKVRVTIHQVASACCMRYHVHLSCKHQDLACVDETRAFSCVPIGVMYCLF